MLADWYHPKSFSLERLGFHCVHFVEGDLGDFDWPSTGFTVRTANLGGVAGYPEFYAALAGALSFPSVPTNMNALHDWLTDLSWLEQGSGWVLLVEDATRFWSREPRLGGALVDAWQFCANRWATAPRVDNLLPPRLGPVPFLLMFLLD